MDLVHSCLAELLVQIYFEFHMFQSLFNVYMGIRASVDALCRDGTNEISPGPRAKRLLTRRECLARP